MLTQSEQQAMIELQKYQGDDCGFEARQTSVPKKILDSLVLKKRLTTSFEMTSAFTELQIYYL
jgi:hypothetical protein